MDSLRLAGLARLARVLGPATMLALCVSCGDDIDVEVSNPYDGPLYVEASGPHGDSEVDGGAAERVVSCDGPAVAGGISGSPYVDGEAFDSPDEAMDESGGGFIFDGARTDFRVARAEEDRVLFTYDVGGITKQAVIVHDGPAANDEGWYVESWARCDLAEFPASVAEATGTQLWFDDSGHQVHTDLIVSYAGPEHCDWQESTFLTLGEATYVRNPPQDLGDGYFDEEWDDDTELPATADTTGYHRLGADLWLSSDQRRAYVVQGDNVELWPREAKFLGCL